jgi:tetratricopeptide (TPR) repeat protein
MKSWMIVPILVLIFSIPVAFTATVQEIPATSPSKEALQHFNKGLYYLDVARGIEARDEFSKAVQIDPTFAHAYFYLSLSALSPEEFNQNLARGEKQLQGKSEGEKILFQINRTFIDNDAAKRIELAKALVAKYPQAPRAWLRLGFSEGSINHFVEARKAFQKAFELDPTLIGAPFALYVSYVFNEPRDFNQAKHAIDQAIQLQPKEAKCYEGLGDVMRAMNQLEKARDAYTKAINLDPNLDVANLKKGHIDSFLGHYDAARADYDKSIGETQKVNKIGYSNFKAFTYIYAGQPDVALEELQKLVDSADSMGLPADQSDAAKLATLNNALTVAFHHNMLDQAQSILDQIMKLTDATIQRVQDPEFERQQRANLVLLDGQIAARKKDYQTARKKAEENKSMVERDSSPRKLEGYYGLLALVEHLQGNDAKAVDLYKKADRTILYVKYQYAVALNGAGNKEEAKKIFKEISQYNFNLVDFALVRKDAIRMSA